MRCNNQSKVSKEPLVTFCVATYNAELFIERTVQSICSQTYSHIRCIISDDHSSDRTVEVCNRLALGDSRILVQSNETRLGWMGNLNRILNQDLSDYFIIVSHDDVLLPNCVEQLLTELQAHPNASVAYSDLQESASDKADVINFTYDCVPVDSLPTKRARCVLWGKGHWWLPYHGLVRSRVLNFERRMRPNLSGEFEGDRLWVLGLAISGDFVHIPRELWIKYRLPDSVANRWKYRLIDVLFVFLSCARFIACSNLSAL